MVIKPPKPPRPRPHKTPYHVHSRPAGQGVPKIHPRFKNPKKPVIFTSTAEGVDLGLIKVWQDLAASECRLELMTKLKNLNLGLAEVEEFNLGINVQFRSEKSREKLANGENKFVKAAMESKSMDEVYKNSEITRERNKKSRELAEQYGKNTRRYTGIIKKLKTEARLVKTEYKEKYKNKLQKI